MSTDDVYEKLADKMSNLAIKNPLTKEFRKILEALYTPEEAEILLTFNMPMVDRFTAKKIAKKLKRPQEEVEPLLLEMARKQRVFCIEQKAGGKVKKFYSLFPLVPGVFEFFFANHKRILTEEKELAKMFADEFDKYYMLGFSAEIVGSNYPLVRVILDQKNIDKTVKKGKGKILNVNEVVEDEMKYDILIFDQIKKMLEQEEKIATLDCCCKIYKAINDNDSILEMDCSNGLPVNDNKIPVNKDGKQVHDYPINVCMVCGFAADYCVQQGFARYVNKQEALEIVRRGSEAGLVHSVQNTREDGSMICNCDPECCISLRVLSKFRNPAAIASSNFRPEYEKNACTFCEICVEKCPMKALQHHYGHEKDKSDERIMINEELCIGCGTCAFNCPSGAMTMIKKYSKVPSKDFGDMAGNFMKERVH